MSAKVAEEAATATAEQVVEVPPPPAEPAIEPTPESKPEPAAEAETPPASTKTAAGIPFMPPPKPPNITAAVEAKESSSEKPRGLFGSLFGPKR